MYVHIDCYTLLERSLGRKGLLRDAQIYEVLLKFSMISLAAEIRQAAGKEMLPMACRRCVCSSTSAKGVTHWLKFTATSCTGPCAGFLMTLPDFKCWDLSFQAECLPWSEMSEPSWPKAQRAGRQGDGKDFSNCVVITPSWLQPC